jgi:hypothetical protein
MTVLVPDTYAMSPERTTPNASADSTESTAPTTTGVDGASPSASAACGVSASRWEDGRTGVEPQSAAKLPEPGVECEDASREGSGEGQAKRVK